MSEYNQHSHYGVNYGSQNHTNAPYLPPYPNQYSQTNDGGSAQQNYIPNYDVNAAGYGYNQSVPGFNPTSVASVVPPLPIYQGWNQDPMPLPTYNAPSGNMYSNQNYSSFPQPYPSIPQHQAYQPNPRVGKPYDDRKVSDTDYSTAYAPPNHTPVIYSSAQYRGADGNGYVDTAHRAVYPTPQDAASIPVNRSASNDYSYNTHDTPQVRRPQSSTSHTPYAASPTEDISDTRSAPKDSQNTRAQAMEKLAVQFPASASSNINKSTPVNGKAMKSLDKSAPTRPPDVPVLVENPTRYVSTAEGREDAKLAVLKLYPQKIGYTEIIEGGGVSEEYLKAVFDDLKLSRGTGTPVNGRSAPGLNQDQKPGINGSGALKAHDSSLSATSKPDSGQPRQANEDKIVVLPSGPTGVEKNRNVSPDSPTTSTKSSTVAEKEKTLQLKMEALRKSREERAQKAAAKNASATPVTNDPAVALRESTKPTTTQVTPPVAKPEPAVIPVSQKRVQATAPLVSTLLSTSNTKEHSSLVRQDSTPPLTALVQPFQSQHSQLPPTLPSISQSSSNAPLVSEQPVIPGLFMNQRKRPVAADFDTPVAMSPFKRPFGHSRSDTPLIIDVSESEDEDDDIEMELDSPNDQESYTLPGRKMSDQRNSAIQNPPQPFNFGNRKPAYTPPQVSVTPVIQKVGKVEVLRQKEQQIEEMRRKIAEAEAAKAQKKAQRIVSGSNTPRPTSVNTVKVNENNNESIGETVGAVQAATQIQQKIDNAEVKVNTEQKRLAEAHAVELEKAAELKKQEMQSKQLRRQKIVTDLPRVDAEVQEKKRKLEEIRAQMAQMEAEVQKTLDDKQKMADELEALGQEAEDQLQSQKRRLDELNDAVNGSGLATPLPTSPSNTVRQSQQAIRRNSQTRVDQEMMLAEERCLVDPTNGNGDAAINSDSPGQSRNLEAPVSSVTKDIANPDHVLEAALQEAARAEAESSAQGESDVVDTEDFYGPEDAKLVVEAIPTEDEDQNQTYSPITEQPVLDSPRPDGHDVDSILPILDTPLAQEEDSDDYEPAEAASPSAPFNTAPIQTSTDDAMFDDPEVRDEGEITDEAEYVPTTNKVEIPTEQTGDGAAPNQMDTSVVATDASTDSEPTQSQSNRKLSMSNEDIEAEETLPQFDGGAPVLTQVPIASNPNHTSSFTPYESPLKYFHAFRFHPEYNEAVPGGYRSLTYSHKINANDTFCPWELGGVCNDKTCTYQHFKDVGLPDDAVLSKLGSPDEFMGEQRTLFCDGLKGVLNNLRARKIRSFDLIAQSVVEHRAKFLGDKSKVLPLEGTFV